MLKDTIEATLSSDSAHRADALPILKLLAALAADAQGTHQALVAVIADLEADQSAKEPAGEPTGDLLGYPAEEPAEELDYGVA